MVSSNPKSKACSVLFVKGIGKFSLIKMVNASCICYSNNLGIHTCIFLDYLFERGEFVRILPGTFKYCIYLNANSLPNLLLVNQVICMSL